MKSRWSNHLLVLVLVLMSASGLAAQQQNSDNAPKANVVLGGTSGEPGEEVVVPVYLTPPEGTNIGKLTIEVTFVSVNLKYEKIESGIAADMAGAKVAGDTSAGKNDQGVETTTVKVVVEAPSKDKGVPTGLLSYLTLKISEKGRPATIALRTKSEGTELSSGKPLSNLNSADADVEVIAPGTEPAVACFFFTH